MMMRFLALVAVLFAIAAAAQETPVPEEAGISDRAQVSVFVFDGLTPNPSRITSRTFFLSIVMAHGLADTELNYRRKNRA